MFTGATGRPERDCGSQREAEDWSHGRGHETRDCGVPVSDVDRAKDRYQSLGWLLDANFVTGPDFRVIQMNPGLGSRSFSAPGSPQTRPVRRRASPPACRAARHPRAAYGSLTGLAEALRRVRRSRTASTRSRPRSAPRNAAHRARGRAADVAALAVHIITDTALAGATYDIDGGQQLIPTASE